MHNNGKPHTPRQVLDVVVIGEALIEDELRAGLQHQPELQMHA